MRNGGPWRDGFDWEFARCPEHDRRTDEAGGHEMFCHVRTIDHGLRVGAHSECPAVELALNAQLLQYRSGMEVFGGDALVRVFLARRSNHDEVGLDRVDHKLLHGFQHPQYVPAIAFQLVVITPEAHS
jgi:hypothetical protein